MRAVTADLLAMTKDGSTEQDFQVRDMDADADSPSEATANARKGALTENDGGDAKRSADARISTSGRSRYGPSSYG